MLASSLSAHQISIYAFHFIFVHELGILTNENRKTKRMKTILTDNRKREREERSQIDFILLFLQTSFNTI